MNTADVIVRAAVCAAVALCLTVIMLVAASWPVDAEADVRPKVERYWQRQLVDDYRVVRCGPNACRVEVRIPGFRQVLVCRWYPRAKPGLKVRCFAVRTYPLASPA